MAESTTNKPPYKPPPPEKYNGKKFRPYVVAIGQVVLAWNDLHEYLGYLFANLMGDYAYDKAGDIWYSATQDRAAREMLKAALKKPAPGFNERHPSANDDIIWVLGQVATLEEARNNIIHSPMISIGEGIMPVWIFGHARATKLAKKPDLMSELIWCRDTALELRNFVRRLDDALLPAKRQRAWPKRPSLPNRGQRKNGSTQPRRPHTG